MFQFVLKMLHLLFQSNCIMFHFKLLELVGKDKKNTFHLFLG